MAVTVVKCRFNDAVDCNHDTKCSNCGWNPAVVEKRMKEFHETGEIVVGKWKNFRQEVDA